MGKIIKLLILCTCAAFGCGSYEEQPAHMEMFANDLEVIDAPEFAGFAGPVDKAEYCDGQGYGSNVCSPDYIEEKSNWVSAQYYGFGAPPDNHACFAPNGVVGDCWFPKFKQFKVSFDTTACLSNNVPILNANQMVTDIQSGILSLNSVGGGVTVSTTTGSQPTHMVCGPLAAGAMGSSGLSGLTVTMIGNLPVAPNGVDESAGRQINGSAGTFDIQQAWDGYNKCLTAMGLTTTAARQRLWGTYLGRHEMLHAMGFAHFTTGLMQPIAPCQDIINNLAQVQISAQMTAALQHYVGGTTSPSIISDQLPTPL